MFHLAIKTCMKKYKKKSGKRHHRAQRQYMPDSMMHIDTVLNVGEHTISAQNNGQVEAKRSNRYKTKLKDLSRVLREWYMHRFRLQSPFGNDCKRLGTG